MNNFIGHSKKVIYCVPTKRLTYSYRQYFSSSHGYWTRNGLQYLKGSGTTVVKYRPQLSSKYVLVLSTIHSDGSYLPATGFNPNIIREFHCSHKLYDMKSSKVEKKLDEMKEKQKSKVGSSVKELLRASTSNEVAASVKEVQDQKPVPVKPSLKTRIWEECLHYYHGFRLLFIDINVCRKLLGRVLQGKTLSRRESRLLVRTTSDLFRLIPFSVFIIVPFMEFLLPLFIKFFPGMLPSTFQTAKEREDKLKQSLQVRVEMAKFLQKTLDEMSLQHKEHKSEEAKEFAEFFRKVKDVNEYVSNADIKKFAKRFDDEVTLDSLSREQLAALCRVLDVSTMGTSAFLRFHLHLKLRSLAADDRVIFREGIESLDLFELQQACKARGMPAYGLTHDQLRERLREWIDLSLNKKVPPTLLLLSRAVFFSHDSMKTTAEKLKETIRVLPKSVELQTKAAIGEREGKVDNKAKIEVIKEEERKIEEERKERHDEEAKAAVTEPKIIKQEAVTEKKITSKDVELLGAALKTFSVDKKKMPVEKGVLKDLREELEGYKEDLEELNQVRDEIKEPVRESRAAASLFNKVSKMVSKLDKVLADLEKDQSGIEASTASGPNAPKASTAAPSMVSSVLSASATIPPASSSPAAATSTPSAKVTTSASVSAAAAAAPTAATSSTTATTSAAETASAPASAPTIDTGSTATPVVATSAAGTITTATAAQSASGSPAAVAAKPATKPKEEDTVSIDDLMNALDKVKRPSDEYRLRAIKGVLRKVDADKDGVITVDAVLQFIEAISRDNVHLNEQQVEEMLTLLNKEQLIQAEKKIEKALARSLKGAAMKDADLDEILKQKRPGSIDQSQNIVEKPPSDPFYNIVDPCCETCAPAEKGKTNNADIADIAKQQEQSSNSSVGDALGKQK